MKPVLLSGYYKRGSSWALSLTRKDSAGTPIDMTGLVTRAMFRAGNVDGEVRFTLEDGDGIAIADPTAGVMDLQISRTRSALFASGEKVYFDVEQTQPLDPAFEYQTLTYWFTVVQQVTRDD